MKKVLFIMLALLSMQFMYAQQTNIDVDKENIEESILQANAAKQVPKTKPSMMSMSQTFFSLPLVQNLYSTVISIYFYQKAIFNSSPL